MTVDFDAASEQTLSELDALLADRQGPWWDSFYADRDKPCPFFATDPDESLAQWIGQGLIRPGKALDVGCGNARNAIFLARRGFATEGVDYSRAAIDWAHERAAAAGARVALRCASVFELQLEPDGYDLIYDSGCFHHIAPHRRGSYVARIADALKPGGSFGLACFKPEGGSGYSDQQVYERRSMGGGLGYTERRLRDIWSGPLRIRVIRPMVGPGPGSALFGQPFLWALLAHKA